MIKLIIFLLTIVICSSQNRVIQITTVNVQLVLRSVGKLYLLLHNPSCPHSRDYIKNYLLTKTEMNLGMTDCSREGLLCDHLNITHYPTLGILSNVSFTIIDEQLFLANEELIPQNDPKIITNSILNRLRNDPNWAAVILEEQKLPTLDKVEDSENKGIFYIQNPSKLHESLTQMVGQKIGCWILQKKAESINKYYCGSGYNSEQILKYVQNLNKGRLIPHIFTADKNHTYLPQTQLSQMIKDIGVKYNKCKLVYFFSKNCQHCSLRDVQTIGSLLTQLKIQNKFSLYIYDIDSEQLPTIFKLRRVPQLVQFCNSQAIFYGNLFTIKSLTKFLQRNRQLDNSKSEQL